MSRQPDKFRWRLKQLLGLKSNPNVTSPQLPPPSEEGPVFSDELLKEIGKENSLTSRARILKELCEVVGAKRLEENAVEALWLAVEDLLNVDVPSDVRHVTLQFLTSLITGQFDTLKLLRAHFFRVIQNHNIPDDLLQRLLFLKALTADGKEIGYFEEYIGPFLLLWMPDVVSGEKSRSDIFLPLLRNIIRYHASYLDEDVVAGLVKQTCHMSNTTDKETDVKNALDILDAVIRYSSLPSSALYHFVVAVCNTVNVEKFCEPSWRLMKHLLGTHLGHNAVLTMCYLLEDSQNWKKFSLLRGAIFFVGMCLWGSKRVTSLKHKPIAVLPSFYKVLSCDNESVICEVTLSMQRLVKKYGSFQHVVAWETMLDITVALQEYVERHPTCGSVSDNFHILVSYIEELYEKHQFNGSPDKLFSIVERCMNKRPESSVILLVSYRSQSLHPYYDNWFGNIKDLMEKYFKYEERTQVRINVLDALSNILKTFSHLFEDEILDHSVLPYLDGIAKDQDIAVRIRAVQLLVEVIEVSDTQKVTEVLNIIEKVAKCPVDPLKRYVKPSHHGQGHEQLQDEKGLEDIKEAVLGLVRLFKMKLFRQPQAHAERIFNILVTHIKTHYDNGYRTFISAEIRLPILECLLALRADSCHRLGIVQGEDHEIKFSSYFRCLGKESATVADEKRQETALVIIPYSEAMNVILMCLQQEWEWQVLEIVLRDFPEALQDKNLILTGKQYLNSVCSVLCKMVSNYDFLSGLCSVPRDIRRLHLYKRIFPAVYIDKQRPEYPKNGVLLAFVRKVLTELSTYHNFIDKEQQAVYIDKQRPEYPKNGVLLAFVRKFCLVRTMEIGLVSGSAALCISCLTTCILEMPSVMASLLPTFLQCFVKLSPSSQVALPLLEFLSALSNLRDLYTNFTNDDFQSVFRTCLPYTNSSRYSQYTVTLAHHVVASWYVHCPLLLRKQFVSYIVKNLKEPPDLTPTSPVYLKLPGSPQRPQSSPMFPQNTPGTSGEDGLVCLSEEMLEIMVDMMAKYTFSSSLTQPKRTAVVEQLLANGTSRSWLLGNKLVTVTVSKHSSPNYVCSFCSSGSPTSVETKTYNEPRPGAENQTQKYESDKNRSCQDESTVRGPQLTGKESANAREAPGNELCTTNIVGQRITPSKNSDTNTLVEAPSNTQDATMKGRPPASQCGCVCQNWAEFLVRRPTGSTSWILRLQNRPKRAGEFSSTQRLVDQKCPRIYESVIPKQFFDDLAADLQREQNKEMSSCSTLGVLSKSEDSDTLIVELVKANMEEKERGNGLHYQQREDNLENVQGGEDLEVKHGEDEQDCNVDNATEKTVVTCNDSSENELQTGEKFDMEKTVAVDSTSKVKFDDNKDIEKSYSSSSLTALDLSTLASSFMERTRLLSRSPGGLSAFMVLDSGLKFNSPSNEISDDLNVDVDIQQQFQKPIVGKSPLDASPLKARLYREESSEENLEDIESDVNISMDDEDIDFSLGPTRTEYETSTPNIATGVTETCTSLPGSRTQSPFTGMSCRHRLSESSGGSSSLPTSPRVSPKKREQSPQFFSGKTKQGPKDGRSSADRRTTPVENIREAVNIPARKDAKVKSATVDIGMIRRISSSPDLNAPKKEKRGILKLFTADGDKEKLRPVPLRRQTLSGTQLLKKKSAKRRSYNGPFPDLEAKNKGSDVIDHYDAMSPNFIFLQFYHSSDFGPNETPLAVPEEQFFQRAVKNLDRIPSYDTHKIGVIYVGLNQETNEVAILRNLYGSSRYMNFLSGLGELVRLRDCALSEVYTGGLDRNGADGEYAYSWRSEIAQIIFHAATLMPNKEKDLNCHSKKLHIGNDFVTIVYNDSKAKYNMGTIKGQFNFVEVVIKPLDNESNVITLNIKDEFKDILTDTNCGPRVISDKNLPILVRHIALHVNMASVIHQSQKTPSDAYGCNWLQRLRQLKRIQSRIPTGTQSQDLGRNTQKDSKDIVDFTEYIL